MATGVKKSVSLNEHLPLDFRRPSTLSPEVLVKIKMEIVRIGNNGTRIGLRFAQKMFAKYPELRGA
jgi:hypothetical protein